MADWITKPPPTLEEEIEYAARTMYALRHIPLERLLVATSARGLHDEWHMLNSMQTSLTLATQYLGFEDPSEGDGVISVGLKDPINT